eukprot:CAMPEP_0177641356 /NCGR_PEP_ID=MMETSP0447-20121125/7022_1 /TAXON_ID=0 /ORGANISM="Stygamoeba regulata, Strain BSH-02190019" /LENGTH=536 /DNA_ID=CAMNT_0019143467 /DNA_START=178 /DNA_END=1788 /DNA_ORIENTATION=+
MTEHSYEKDLWDGFDAVFERYKIGKATLVDMGKFASELQNVEEKSSKSMLALQQGKTHWTEKGTLGHAWALIRHQHESDGGFFQDWATTLLTSVSRPVEVLRKEHSSLMSKYESDLGNLDREMQRSQAALEKTRSAFHRAGENADNALSSYERARNDPNFPPKSLTKLHAQQTKLKKEMEDADAVYKQQLEEHRQNQMKYEEGVKQVLQGFEKMEVERLKACKDMVTAYLQGSEQMVQRRKATFVKMRQAVEEMNPDADIQNFISLCKTGQTPEPYVVYEPYEPAHPELIAQASAEPGSPASKSLFSRKSHQFNAPQTGSPPSPRGSNAPPPASLPPPSSGGGSTAQSPLSRNGNSAGSLSSSGRSSLTTSATPPTSSPLAAVAVSAAPATLQAKAIFDYAAQEPGELTFPVGAIINVSIQDPSGWWTGEYQGATGMFPGNFTQLIGAEPATAAAASPAAVTSVAAVAATTPVVTTETVLKTATVQFDFTATSPDELTILPGERLTILSETAGWCMAQNERGQTGTCPMNYLAVDP